MKKRLLSLCQVALLCLLTTIAYSQTPIAWFNFTNGRAIEPGWTNFTGFTNGSSATSGSITLTLTNVNGTDFSAGFYGLSGNGTIPEEVHQMYHYIKKNDNEVKEYLVTGLDDSKTYSFQFFASRSNDGTVVDRTTHYSIGSSTDYINADGNTDKTVTLTDIKSINGTVTLTIQKDISAKYGYINAIIIKEETPSIIVVTGVSLNQNTTTLSVGETLSLTETITPPEATDPSVSWSSSNDAVATVDSNGLVTSVSEGMATITVTTTDQGYTADCDITVQNVAVTGVSLDRSMATVSIGSSIILNASVSPPDATDQTVTWTSSDENVATVNANGNVQGIAAGSSTITVTTNDGGEQASCLITVEPIPVESISLSRSSLTLNRSQSTLLSPTITPLNATNKNVTWTSSNTSVATVTGGLVKAINAGTTIVEVKTVDGDYIANCTVTVNNSAPVSYITLEPSNITLEEGLSSSITASVSPYYATDKTLTWVSLDENYVIVDDNGNITALAQTPATHPILVRAFDVSGSIFGTSAITVIPATPVTGISLNSSSSNMIIGDQEVLTATIQPSNATIKMVNWTSSNSEIATVSGGIIHAVGIGTATITATSENGGFTAACTINVTGGPATPFNAIAIEPSDVKLYALGETAQLEAIMTPEETCGNCTQRMVNWHSVNPAIASVDQNGLITAVGEGTTTITVTGSPSNGPSTTGITVTVVFTTTTEIEGNIRLVPDADRSYDRFDIIFGAQNKQKGRIWTPGEGGLNLASEGFDPHMRIGPGGRVLIPKLAGPVDLSNDLSIQDNLSVDGKLSVDGFSTFDRSITSNSNGYSTILTCNSSSPSPDFELINASNFGFMGFKYRENMIFSHDFAHIPLQLNANGTVVINNWMDNWDDYHVYNNDHELIVNGSILSEGIRIVSEAIKSDFVFEEDYELRPLEEVESYVKEHKHLPEIPAATDFHSGYQIDVMDDLLLRKIEELTLYTIELEKQVKSMQEKLKK